MTDLRNSQAAPPGGLRFWSGNPPTSQLSGDGATVFYGANAKDRAGVLWYIVWSVAPDGAQTERLRIGPNAGQGTLAVDSGWLILTIYRGAGDGQAAERIAVSGWVRRVEAPPPPIVAPELSADDRRALDRLKAFLG